MTITVLIDLDDTLLYNNMDRFLPGYIKGLSTHLSNRVEPKLMVQSLLDATRKMTEKRLPAGTLKDTFDSHFYPAIGIRLEDIDDQIQDFYANRYPDLRALTHQVPAAIELVKEFFIRNWNVVIATNPLFPRTAIMQRLEWAGLSANRYPFLLIPSYETMHFSKPHPAYFAELLGQTGWPDGPVFVVGNSLSDDIEPAARLGLPAFWLTEDPQNSVLPQNCAAGSLAQVLPWMDEMQGRDLPAFAATISAWKAVLQATPAALETRTSRYNDHLWHTAPASGEWNAIEILCHLRDVDAEVNLPRIRRILAEDTPLLTGIETDQWAEERHYADQSGPQAMLRFMQTRMEMLQILLSLKPEEWQRTCRHTIFGRTTLADLVSFMATHDRTHIQQLCRAVECRD